MTKKYPRYFIVEFDIPARLEEDSEGMITGYNYLDNEMEIGRILEGQEVEKSVYEKEKEKLLQDLDKRAFVA